MHVPWLYCHPLRVQRAQVGVLKQRHQVRLRRLLQRSQRMRLEAPVRRVLLSNLTHQPLEGQLAEEQVCVFLVPDEKATDKVICE